jgi:hypothetical protein
MSTTIGFGLIRQPDDENLEHELLTIAQSFGYNLSYGVKTAESDVQEGLTLLQDWSGWNLICLLHAPGDCKVPLAFGIEEELRNCESKIKEELKNGESTQVKFFDFLRELEMLFDGRGKKLGIFFSGEWYSDTKIRREEGSLDNLLSLLKKPGNWNLLLFNLQNGIFQECDYYPLVYLIADMWKCSEI